MRLLATRFIQLSLLLVIFAVSSAVGKPERGIGLWEFEGAVKGLEQLHVSWYYNWKVASRLSVDSSIEFVPMIWDEADVNEASLQKARMAGEVLLGFNEPDHENQANMSVELALSLWPQLEATGMRLGSPAIAGDASSTESWLGQFMAGVQMKGYRVDFICVHNYQTNFSDPKAAALGLKTYLEKVYELYRKPIWLTEFSLSNWKVAASSEEQADYMREVLPAIHSLGFVERYAWFALPPNEEGDGGTLTHSNLCDDEGTLNTLGMIYKYFQR